MSPASRFPRIRESRGWPLALAVVLVVLVVAAYAEAPRGSFHFDDVHNIVDVPAMHPQALTVEALAHAASGARLPRRVVANLSFALDWWRGGGAPGPFLTTNVAVHASAAVAVFALMLSVLGRVASGAAERDRRTVAIAAFVAAALWALHPIQVQSVALVVQRMAALAGLFAVLSVLLFLEARTARSAARRGTLYALCALCVLLGVASKENAAVAVLLIALAEIAFFRGGLAFFGTRAGVVVAGGAAALAGLAAIDLCSGAGPLSEWLRPGYALRDFTLGERLLTQPRVIAFHLSQILWPAPWRFSLEHDIATSSGLLTPPSTALALAGLGLWCTVGAAALAVRRFRAAGFFMLWVPAALSVESSVLALEMVFEHRMYLPSVGLAGLAALGAAAALDRAAGAGAAVVAASVAAALAVSVALGAATAMRLPAWHTMAGLCRHSVAVAPRSARAWACLGFAHLRDGEVVEAQAALERSLALDPRSGETLALYGVTAMMRGDLAAAEARMVRALALPGLSRNHRDILLHSNLGIIRARLGRHREAVVDFHAALAEAYLMPDDAARLGNLLALSYRAMGATDRARDAFEAALAASPREWQAGYNLARLHLAAGRREAARRTLTEARRRALAAGASTEVLDRLLDRLRE